MKATDFDNITIPLYLFDVDNARILTKILKENFDNKKVTIIKMEGKQNFFKNCFLLFSKKIKDDENVWETKTNHGSFIFFQVKKNKINHFYFFTF